MASHAYGDLWSGASVLQCAASRLRVLLLVLGHSWRVGMFLPWWLWPRAAKDFALVGASAILALTCSSASAY